MFTLLYLLAQSLITTGESELDYCMKILIVQVFSQAGE